MFACWLAAMDWKRTQLGLEQGPLEVQLEIAHVKFATRELWMQSISSLLAEDRHRLLNTAPPRVQRQLPDPTVNPTKFAEII